VTGLTINASLGLGSGTPNMDGTGAAGSASSAAHSDHTHPTDTSRQAASISETAGASGVTLNYLAAKDGSNPTRYVSPSSGGCGSGIAGATATSGNTFPFYAIPGSIYTGVADNAVTAGHILVGGITGGTVGPGGVRDSGQTAIANVAFGTCVVGVAQGNANAGATVSLLYAGVGTFGQSGAVTFTANLNVVGTDSGGNIVAGTGTFCTTTTELAPVSGDVFAVLDPAVNATITSVVTGTAAATSTVVDLKPASESAWGTLGSSILSGTITATPSGASGTISTPALSAGTPLMAVVGTVTDSVLELYIKVCYTRGF